MKLSTKIRLFSSLFMLVLVLLVNTAIYYLFYNMSLNAEKAELTDQTNEITEALNESPNIAKSDLLKAYLPTDGMVRIIGKDGEFLIPTLTKDQEFTELPFTFSKKQTAGVIELSNQADFLTISKPIIWENGEVATLQVYKQLVAHSESMETLFYVLAVASVIVLIPTIIAGTFLSRFILKPIKSLTGTMKENITDAKWKKINLENRSRDELYEMEETFNVMIEYLKDNFERQETFVSDASHELKTPISIVKSYAQLLKRRGQDNPELLNESVQAVDSEADRMQKLVEQMLLLAKNQENETYSKLDIIQLTRETVDQFKGAYDRELTFEAEAEKIMVNGNHDQLQQVFYILIDNALKYSDEAVNVYVLRRQSEVQVKVQDYGQGIPQEEAEKIFDRFYRMDKSRSRDLGGTGLGLAIAKAIMEKHKGQLTVSSESGNGSIFSITLSTID
ncbi:HAMP domain-containing sensor histidine kinase [Virgibacillus siamensis]|uniref:HAMP domain-containing sensor histidine kinase n=1 Tax=Virgibacillus siamensis TaxID=480071 RepID=UPI0009873D21|nr:HAMP domain-containing histidine kinase [Virgibacillus siamensis]